MIKTGTHFVHETYMLVYMLQSLMTHERCHTSGPVAGTDPPHTHTYTQTHTIGGSDLAPVNISTLHSSSESNLQLLNLFEHLCTSTCVMFNEV